MPSPFALVEDLETGTARLFEDPRETLAPCDHADVGPALERLEDLRRRGAKLAGWLGYEAGHALDPRLAPLRRGSAEPLMWMAAFDRVANMPIAAVDDWLARRSAGTGTLGAMEPLTDRTAYLARFDRIIEAIRAGDIYQANLTIALGGRWQGDPVAIYRAIRPRAAARFGALVFDGIQWLLSFSPELFFRARGADIETRPMKGTRPRGHDEAADRALKNDLVASRKDRAENLMITDLMRNDLSRLALPGSVQVENPFRIEAYPTVFQMTSTVRAQLANGFDAAAVFGAMFPCGSITGAPKLRAMEIIDAVEGRQRGPYCGAHRADGRGRGLLQRGDPHAAADSGRARDVRCRVGRGGRQRRRGRVARMPVESALPVGRYFVRLISRRRCIRKSWLDSGSYWSGCSASTHSGSVSITKSGRKCRKKGMEKRLRRDASPCGLTTRWMVERKRSLVRRDSMSPMFTASAPGGGDTGIHSPCRDSSSSPASSAPSSRVIVLMSPCGAARTAPSAFSTGG